MMSRIRILPLAIFVAVFLLSVRVGDLWHGVPLVIGNVSVAQVKPGNGDAPAPNAETGKIDENSPENSPVANKQATDGKPGQDQSDPLLFSPAEIDLLQRLAARREELEQRNRELDMREGLLRAAERRVEAKIAELKKLQASIRGLIKTHNDKEEAKLKSLVKIYENMKPKDAARIFNQLELPILLEVVARMREAKTASVLAKMEGSKAKEVTTALAKFRKIPDKAK